MCLLYLKIHIIQYWLTADSVNIKILNAGAWSRSSEKVFVSLPTELEDLIPEVEEFYKKNHSGRKLHWHHLMSNGIVSLQFLLYQSQWLYFLCIYNSNKACDPERLISTVIILFTDNI